MPQQFVYVVEVHVVMVHLVVATGITADITVGIHLCAPFLFCSCKVHSGILRRMGYNGFYSGHLTLGIGIEMGTRAVAPSQHVANISGTPTRQRHAPTDAAVQPSLSVPITVGGKDEGSCQRVQIGVWGLPTDAGCQLTVVGNSIIKQSTFADAVHHGYMTTFYNDIDGSCSCGNDGI